MPKGNWNKRKVRTARDNVAQHEAAMKVEQNVPVDPPQSFERPKDEPEVSDVELPMDVVKDAIDAMYEQKKEPLTARGAIKKKLCVLSGEISELEPRSLAWNMKLEEIGNLKRKLDKTK